VAQTQPQQELVPIPQEKVAAAGQGDLDITIFFHQGGEVLGQILKVFLSVRHGWHFLSFDDIIIAWFFAGVKF
jgi:hypothetical protein